MPGPTWEDIVNANSGVVLNAALRVLGCLPDAEDVAQEVLVEAFQKWTPLSQHAWPGLLRRMATCRALDLLRSRRKMSPLAFQPVDSRETAADQPMSQQELGDQLRALVAELPKRESEVFCLACFERLSHQEIADVLQISKSSVATLLGRARQKLTAILPIIHGDAK